MAYHDVIGYVVEGAIYCPDCIDDKDKRSEETGAYFSYIESDSPVHCSNCMAFLGASLTEDGYRELVERIREFQFEYWPDVLEEYMAHWAHFDWYVIPTFAGKMQPLTNEMKSW